MDLKIYAKTIEVEAQEQVYRMANSEAYSDCKIRIMPDCHAGKGCTVGTVIEIKDKVVPNTVGVDIGCGMLVCKLGDVDINLVNLDKVINEKIPYGFASHNNPVTRYDSLDKLKCRHTIDLDNALRQIGSLGGGNHFIEVNVDDKGDKYLVIHSGSRHLGVEVCKYYQELANKNLNNTGATKKALVEKLKAEGREREIENELKKFQSPKCDRELAYLDSKGLEDYLFDMAIVQSYASLNRKMMADIILKNMGLHAVDKFETIHNYVDIKNGIVRKGAVKADMGEILIIPINMRDGSLLCQGKGNKDWLCSAPHGAGRLLSRSKARKLLTMEDFKTSMNGIYTTSVCESTIDEAPMAYKHIDEIIECIQPTVNIVNVIKPIYNFKAK
jgi:RNA-splicing ligase RtcB